MNHSCIGAAHLLLGILRSAVWMPPKDGMHMFKSSVGNEDFGARMIKSLHVDIERARDELINELESSASLENSE